MLPFAVKYRMDKAAALCLHRIGRDKKVRLDDVQYKKLLPQLTPDTMMRVMEALSRNVR